ncbi:MAG: hypothetical protein QF453_02710 [Candidatus Marinimicrobia bacterium]|nr:hypothetical protein [Candidatus Neomarinimicrobiota bacterium]
MNRGFFSLGSVTIIGWMVFYGCTAIPEKNNSVSIEASLDTSQVTIGDIVHLTVEVGAISNQRLLFSELNVEHPIEIRKKSILKEENKIQFQIVIWDTGSYMIPGYSIGISHDKDSTLDFSLETNPLKITVVSTLTGDPQSTIKPIKEPVPIVYPTPWARIAQWSFFLFTILTLLFALSKRQNFESFVPAHYENIQSPYSRAVERLEKLGNKLDDKTFYVNLSHILREFVEHSVFIKSLEMTTEEIIVNKHTIPIDNALLAQWISLLSRSDQIKYAREVTSKNQRIEDINWSKEFLKWAKIHWELT